MKLNSDKIPTVADSTIIALWCILFLTTYAQAARSETGSPRVINGPMVGWVSPTEISVWARITGEYAFSLQYGTDSELSDSQQSDSILAKPKNDFMVHLTLKDLKPDTTYYYRVLVEGSPSGYNRGEPFKVKTAPAPGEKTRFSIGFGSCARARVDPEQIIWKQVKETGVDLFFWLGDNIYGDSLYGQFLAEEYRFQRDIPSLQPVLRSIPHLAIWDDHDYGLNDHDRENPIRDIALAVFKNYWANPSYGLPQTPGVFFHYHYGGVDFFFLDGRYHRDPPSMPDQPGKTHLGKEQLNWLKSGLSKSKAPFKVLLTGTGWTSLKGPDGDSWSAALHERNQLFDYIRDESISGVLLVSGDTHRGELYCIPWSDKGGYDLYEFVSSPLAQKPSVKVKPKLPEIYIRDWYHDSSNFGYMTFDLTENDPVMRYNLIDTFGDTVYEWFEIRASKLVNGTKSWPSKISEEERLNREKGLLPD